MSDNPQVIDAPNLAAQAGGQGNTQINNNFFGATVKTVLDAASKPERPTNNFGDWAKELPERQAEFSDFPDSAAKLQALRTHGLLAVDCADTYFLHELAAWIATTGGYDRRLLIDQNNEALFENTQRLNLTGYIDWLRVSKKDKAEKLLVVLHVDGSLLPAALADAKGSLPSYKSALANEGIHLLFLLYAEACTSLPRDPLKNAASLWILPVLPMLLRRVLGATPGEPERVAKAGALQARIEAQRRDKRWAASESAFLRELQGALGDENLLDALEAEADRRAIASTVSLARPVQERSELARTGNLVERAVLFTAAFLGRCSVDEQMDVIKAILGTKKLKPVHNRAPAPVRPRAGVPATPPPPEEDGELAFEYWQNESLIVMERCGVRRVTGSEGARFVEFSSESMAEIVRTELSDTFTMESFEAISRTMIFDQSINQSLVDKLIRVSAEICELYPGRFGETWLRSVLGSISHVCAMTLQVEIPEQILLGDLFRKLAEALEKNGRLKNRLHYRLTALCSGLMEKPAPKSVVMRFIEALINETAFGTAARLAERLWSREPEAAYRWLKRCLNEAPQEEREEAEEAIFSLAQKGPVELDLILRAVQGWLPDEARDAANLSESEIFATLLPLRFHGEIKIAERDPALADGNETSAQRWERLVKWLCNPKLDEVLTHLWPQEMEASPDCGDHNRAFCIASWALRSGTTGCLVIINALRSHGSMRQQRVVREVLGQMLAEADKRWLKAADAAFRSPSSVSQKRDGEKAKVHREVLKICWVQLGKPA